MTYTIAFLSVISAIVSAAYLQLPTFILDLGYRWFHNYKSKRWIWRCISILSFTSFLLLQPPVWLIILTSVFILFFLTFSLVNANPKVYVALNENQIIKQQIKIYTPETEVLGYVDESGFAICYPLQEMIKPRHLLNDLFNNKPLFVSYCMACRSAMVYNPVVNGQRLNFEVLGVYRRNMVMGDTTTGTIWQQGTGEAIYGSLKGQRLKFLPYQQTTLNDWLKQYPDSHIATESGDVKNGIFSKERLMKMMKVTEALVAPGKINLNGLPLREPILGIEIGDLSKAYPISELKKKNSFTDKLGYVELKIEYNPVTNFIHILNLQTNEIVVAQSHWWFGWKEFHKNSEIWKA
jgi:hypothetical protein